MTRKPIHTFILIPATVSALGKLWLVDVTTAVAQSAFICDSGLKRFIELPPRPKRLIVDVYRNKPKRTSNTLRVLITGDRVRCIEEDNGLGRRWASQLIAEVKFNLQHCITSAMRKRGRWLWLAFTAEV